MTLFEILIYMAIFTTSFSGACFAAFQIVDDASIISQKISALDQLHTQTYESIYEQKN